MRSSLSLIARLSFFALLILAVPAATLAVLYARPFEELRRAKAVRVLSNAIDMKVDIKGPVSIDLGWELTVSLADVVALESQLPGNLKGLSAKALSIKIPLLPLLAGRALTNSLTIDGLKAVVDVPAVADPDGDDADLAATVGDFVRSRFADDIRLRDGVVDYLNQDTGFTLHYVVDALENKPTAEGGVVIKGAGRLNGEPWALDGSVDPPGDDADQRKFNASVLHAGVKSSLAGAYKLDPAGDTVDMTVSASTPNLKQLLVNYGISGDLEGAGSMAGRLAGTLDALKLSDLALNLSFASGDKFDLTGNVANLGDGTGLDLTLVGSLARKPLPAGEAAPIYDIGITGFNGRIQGSVDGVLVRDFHLLTNSIKANLHEIGPVTAERVYKDPEGHLGLYDVLVLAGDPKRPSVRVSGTVKDIIAFKGVDLKGAIDFLTADFLDLAAEEHRDELGHLSGDIAISDADGSLGIEQLKAQVTDSALIKLDIELVFDDIPEAKELKFDTRLDIPQFKPFAAALGSQVDEVGEITFDGTIAGSDERIAMSGKAVVGQTALVASLTATLSQGKPVLAGDISTDLLYLADLLNLASINSVYEENIDEQDADVFDYSKVWESLFVDLQIRVAKLAGGGNDASNIAGRVTYLAGVVGLDAVTLTYLGGKATASGEINTTGAQNTFALKGNVDNLRIGDVLRELKSSYPVSGLLQVTYDLSGAGNAKAEIPKSLSGSLNLSLRNGWIGTNLLDLAGMSLPAWLLTRAPQGNQATLVCAVAPFSFKNGRGSTGGLVLETRDVQAVGVGFIDFRNDQVSLRFKPQTLQSQLISTAQPFEIQGKISSPKVSLTGAPVAGAVTKVIAFPFNLLDSIVQPGAAASGRVPCRVTRAR